MPKIKEEEITKAIGKYHTEIPTYVVRNILVLDGTCPNTIKNSQVLKVLKKMEASGTVKRSNRPWKRGENLLWSLVK